MRLVAGVLVLLLEVGCAQKTPQSTEPEPPPFKPQAVTSEASPSDLNARFVRAVESWDIEGVQALLKQGVAVDTRLPDGWTLLLVAAEKNDFRTAEIALLRNASPRVANDAGWTALHYAAKHGNSDLVRFLVAAGADVNARTMPIEGQPALAALDVTKDATIQEFLKSVGGVPAAPAQ